jgi:hypothetical protein
MIERLESFLGDAALPLGLIALALIFGRALPWLMWEAFQ